MPSEFKGVVFAYLDREAEAVPAGQLKIVEEGLEVISSTFGYGSRYLARPNAIPVDPTGLKLDGALPGGDKEYEPNNELTFFGAIRDAMPDLWGRRVIENFLKKPPNSLSESEYLMQAGSNRFGALDVRKEAGSPEANGLLVPATELQYLLAAADKVQLGEPVPVHMVQLFDAGPSMGGARPKAVVTRGNTQYLAKFPMRGDHFNVPAVERATLELARECGLTVPETDLVSLPDGREVMLIERFDRYKQGNGFARRQAVSALTALELHETESVKASYSDIALKMSDFIADGRVQADRTELFGRMVFNIFVSNDDDHLRNHAFIWQPNTRGWELSPLYDVLPKPQAASTRYLHLGIGKEGRHATIPNALSNAPMFGLLEDKAKEIVDRIATKVREWKVYFEDMAVSDDDIDRVSSAMRHPRDVGWDG
jgi:serine/threonine-protein kinase HipA